MKYRKASHCIFDCKYHIVWITRWRNDAIWWELQEDLEKMLRGLCKKMYVNVISIWMEEDHVHIFVSIPPSKPIPYVVKMLKWNTSKELMGKYREYLRRWYWSQRNQRCGQDDILCVQYEKWHQKLYKNM